MRGSPLIPSEGGQDFKPVVKLITAKKVSQNHGFPSKGSCRRRRLMRWESAGFCCKTRTFLQPNTSSGSLREPPSPQGEGFSARQLLNTAPTPGGIKRGPGPLLALRVRGHSNKKSRQPRSGLVPLGETPSPCAILCILSVRTESMPTE